VYENTFNYGFSTGGVGGLIQRCGIGPLFFRGSGYSGSFPLRQGEARKGELKTKQN